MSWRFPHLKEIIRDVHEDSRTGLYTEAFFVLTETGKDPKCPRYGIRYINHAPTMQHRETIRLCRRTGLKGMRSTCRFCSAETGRCDPAFVSARKTSRRCRGNNVAMTHARPFRSLYFSVWRFQVRFISYFGLFLCQFQITGSVPA